MIVKEFTTRLKLALVAIVSFALLGTPQAISQDKSPTEVTTEAPALTLAITSLDKLNPDVMYLFRASGLQAQAGMVTFFVNQYSQGLDKARPIVLTAELPPGGLEPKVFISLPVADVEKFFAATANFITKTDVGKNQYELVVNTTQAFYAIYDGQWLFVTQNKDDLALHPKSPATLTAPLIKNYDLAVNINLDAVPADSKSEIIANLEQGFKSGFAQNSGMTPEEAEAARKQGEESLQQIKDLINDTDQVMVGLAIDRTKKFVALDFASKFDSSSDSAKQINAIAGLQSSLGTVIQSTDPIQMTYRSKLDKEKIDQMNSSLDLYLKQSIAGMKKSVQDAKQREILTNILTVLIEASKSAMANGEVDSATALNFTNGINIISFSRVANSSEVESKLIGLLNQYKSEPTAPQITSSAQDYKGMKLYSGSWKVPDSADLAEVRRIIGETIPFTLAFGKNYTGLALGVNAEKDAKAAVDRLQSAQPAPSTPFNMSIELLPVLQYASPLVKDPKANAILKAVIAKVSEFESVDKVKVESRVAKDGIIVRATIEEGILQSIGAAAMAGGAGGPPQQRR